MFGLNDVFSGISGDRINILNWIKGNFIKRWNYIYCKQIVTTPGWGVYNHSIDGS